MPTAEDLLFAENAQALGTKIHIRHEPSNRRLRALMGGKWIFDSLEVEYVWEEEYPVYYVPLKALIQGPAEISQQSTSFRGCRIGQLKCNGKTANIATFEEGPLKGLARIAHDGVDSWYAEDEKLLGPYPKDPYKRIECLISSSEVRIELDGIIVASSTSNILLLETRRQPRYYLSPTSIFNWDMLIPSSTSTFCPYKGKASYYHLKVGEREIRDAVWYYEYPVPESAQIQNRLCFFNEEVKIFINGKQQ
ncbi:hypothetical protein B0T11DRAFT_320143 [Plectosphaerella cucumerina]|uniref:DUF427 domain-containing protein n=1 Tax=Plectosphaerella cucumerina TaxID=40658 RepID=A0A8K0TCT8_9PEZI|nr:hypothetical protein B0T11DRAFT_320143 [Plectosphaerella cucumerina]